MIEAVKREDINKDFSKSISDGRVYALINGYWYKVNRYICDGKTGNVSVEVFNISKPKIYNVNNGLQYIEIR